MLDATKKFTDLLVAKEIKYDYKGTTESGKDIVIVRFSGEKMTSIVTQIFFDTDNQSAAFRIFDVVKVPGEKAAAMINTVNAVNCKYRFAKFCYETDDNTIQLEADAIFRANDVAPICHELMMRCIDICDEAYPEFMKGVWA